MFDNGWGCPTKLRLPVPPPKVKPPKPPPTTIDMSWRSSRASTTGFVDSGCRPLDPWKRPLPSCSKSGRCEDRGRRGADVRRGDRPRDFRKLNMALPLLPSSEWDHGDG